MEEGYLSELAAKYVENLDAKDKFDAMKEYNEQRLWHNLTEVVYDLLQADILDSKDLGDFYTKFVKLFETKINPFKLAQIISIIANTYENMDDKLAFMRGILEKVSKDKEAVDAILYLKSSILLMVLSGGQDTIDESKKLLHELEKELNKSRVRYDAAISGNFYLAQAKYFKLRNKPKEFYENMFLYLSYTPTENIPVKQQQEIAYQLGIAGLVGEDNYNFADLLGHPVFASLKGTEYEWLGQLLRAFNGGDMVAYENVATQFEAKLRNEPALLSSSALMKQKISILSLLELVLNRGSTDRVFTFESIAKNSRLPENEVEFLVMKALSLQLIKGSIDQVDGTVTITWVKPRILDLTQIAKMRDRLEEWRKKVHSTLVFLEQQMGDSATQF